MPAQRNSISRLVNWCNRNGVTPEAVDDAIVDRIMTEMAVTSLRPNQYQVRRSMTKVWNEIVDIFPDMALRKVAVPPSRLRRTRVPLTGFPPSLLEHWNGFTTWADGDDIFADHARPKRLKQSTLDTMLRRIHLAANALVESGVDPSAIRTLADLVTVDAFKRILRRRHEAVHGRATYDNMFMAMDLLQIARDLVKVDDATFAELKHLKNLLPRPSFEMTRKNKLLVMKFDQGVLRERLLAAPNRLWRDVQCSTKTGRLRLAEAQAALAINILIYLPVRLGNLASLTFDQHLFLNEDGASTLTLSAEETKTGAAVEYDIPPPLVARLIEYREVIAPAVIGSRPKHLFCEVNGAVKSLATIRYLVQRYFKQYVGIHMNPHAFRHLAAKFILDENPGAHVVVQHLLGHKKLSTTAKFYAGTDTRRAGRHHQTLLEKAIARRDASGSAGKSPRRQARGRGK
jgi:integrase